MYKRLFFIAVLVAGICSHAFAKEPLPDDVPLPGGGEPAENAAKEAAPASFESAGKCAKCHADIYNNWKKSLHALSMSNPIFVTAYRKAYTETRGEAAKYCLDCHAPTVKLTGDFDGKLPVTAEGITCDFCHSVAEVNLDAEEPFVLQPGDVKRSVLSDAESKYHKTARSDDFASSELCAGCHDFVNRNGVHVGVTYREWSESQYAKEGKHCQSCHMPPIEGKTAREGGRESIHDHSLSHNVKTMENAVKVELLEQAKRSRYLTLKLSVTNTGAGHSIPTGTPARDLVLEVRTLDKNGLPLETVKKVYSKTVLDEGGNELHSDGDAFLYGVRIGNDNRLKPGETRIERINFINSVEKVADIEARVYFHYTPTITEEAEMTAPLGGSNWKADY